MYPSLQKVCAMDFPDRDPDRNFNLKYCLSHEPDEVESQYTPDDSANRCEDTPSYSDNEKSAYTRSGTSSSQYVAFSQSSPSEYIIIDTSEKYFPSPTNPVRPLLIAIISVLALASLVSLAPLTPLLESLRHTPHPPLAPCPVHKTPANTIDVSKEKAYAALVIRADNNSTFSVTLPLAISALSTFSSSFVSLTSTTASPSLTFSSVASTSLTEQRTSLLSSELSEAPETSESSSPSETETPTSTTEASSGSVTSFSSVSDGVTYIIDRTTTQTFGLASARTLTLTLKSTANPSLLTELTTSNKGLLAKNKRVVIGCVVGIVGGLLVLALAIFVYFRFYRQRKDERFINLEGLWVNRNGNPDEKMNLAMNSPRGWQLWGKKSGGKSVLGDDDYLEGEDVGRYESQRL